MPSSTRDDKISILKNMNDDVELDVEGEENEIEEVEDEESENEDDLKPLLNSSTNSNSSLNKNRQSRSKKKENSKYRAILLSLSLCFNLMAFWILDSLKDAIFSTLTKDFESNQPLAKMTSVGSTLGLVILMEMMSYSKNKENSSNNTISASLIWNIGLPYALLLTLTSIFLKKHPEYNQSKEGVILNNSIWMVIGYVIYVTIESFGSISVAAFWSFTNSNLDLESATNHYGLIIAIAQLGAICGATIATQTTSSYALLSVPNLIFMAVASIVIYCSFMKLYQIYFPMSMNVVLPSHPRKTARVAAQRQNQLFSGVYLILRHNYLLLIMGVSCLYEIALTCLDYEFKLVSLDKFESSSSTNSVTDLFAQFIGRYGQMINLLSFLLSFYGFPFIMKRFGLRITLRLFPTLLVIATLFAFAIPNLWVLFCSMSILKAIVYSIYDPAKEILYIPTSNVVKFKAKFWIDVVGERFAKALGSSITFVGGENMVQVGIVPSFLSSALLLIVSVFVGNQFDYLVEKNEIIGLDEDDDDAVLPRNTMDSVKYKLVESEEDEDDDWDYFYRDTLKKKSGWSYTTIGKFMKPFKDNPQEDSSSDSHAIQLSSR